MTKETRNDPHPIRNRRHGPHHSSLTRGQAMLGTPSYMSPEQVFGEADIDHLTDVWSLGVILYQAIGGVLPARGANLEQVLKSIIMRPIPPLAALAPELPAGVAALVNRMLSRPRALRPQSLAEVLAVFARYADVAAPAFGPPRPPAPAESAPASSPSPLDDEPTIDPSLFDDG